MVLKRRKNAHTYIYRAINQTRQGSPYIEHYLAHVETPVSDFVRLVRSLARFVLVAPPWHVLTLSCSHSLTQCSPVVLVAHFPSFPCHTFYHSVFLFLSIVLQFPLYCHPFLSLLQTLMQDSSHLPFSRCLVSPTLNDPLARAWMTRMARIIFI